MPRPIVFVVDDDPTTRSSLERLLDSQDLEVRTFDGARSFLERFEPSHPSCLVIDVRLPDMDGFELQQRLRDLGIRIPIIFVSGHGTIPLAVRAMQRGALDFLEKPFDRDALLSRIRQALERDSEDSAVDRRRLTVLARLESLTLRQREVLEHVVSGKANKVIAIEMGLSEKTVELHRAKMMRGMAARSVAELVRMVMDSGALRGPLRREG